MKINFILKTAMVIGLLEGALGGDVKAKCSPLNIYNASNTTAMPYDIQLEYAACGHPWTTLYKTVARGERLSFSADSRDSFVIKQCNKGTANCGSTTHVWPGGYGILGKGNAQPVNNGYDVTCSIREKIPSCRARPH